MTDPVCALPSCRHLVAASTTAPGRYARGVRSPNPVKLAALRALLEADPTLSKAEIGRRVGLSRASVGYYLRTVSADLARARGAAAERRVLSHVDLVERVAGTADELREEIGKLRAAKGTNSATVFAGYRTLVQVERLLGELLGEIKPPTQNTYLVQVAALLDRPLDPSALSDAARVALGEEAARAPSR